MMDTSFISAINWLAVLVAAIAYFMLGALWYSKALFGNIWIRHSGVDMSRPDAKKGMGGIMAFTFILQLIACIGLAILVYRLGLNYWLSGIKLGLLTGICFSAIGLSISFLYQGKAAAMYFIDGGYHVTGQVIAALVLCLWP